MTVVVDASVACKWFIAKDGSQAAEALLAGDALLLAPDLLIAEVANIAWLKSRRGEMLPEQARMMVEGLPRLFDRLTPAAELAEPALEIAVALGHPVYDCLYLALAERHRTHMVTADRRLLARLTGTGWQELAVGLG